MGGKRSPQAGRKVLTAAAAAITALGWSAYVLSLPASALPTSAVAPDTVAKLPDAETTLAVPVDGRINGYQFAGKILGVATGARLGTGAAQITAAPGQQLWVFGLDWIGTTDRDGTPDQVTSTLVVDGTRITFPVESDSPHIHDTFQPNTTWEPGDTYWVASAPAAARDVAVELSAGGYAQTFSLSKMAREGSQPAVLYRAPSSWEVNQPLTDEHDIPLVDPNGDVSGVVLPVVLPVVTLSWFGPDTPSDTPNDAGTAWLVPGLATAGSANSGERMCFEQTLPASDITLTIPGEAHPLTATAFPGLGPDANDQGEGAFTAVYGFQVPAGTTTATLTVNPGTSIQADAGACFLFSTFLTQGTATFNLSLPTTMWTPPPGASTTPASIRALASTQTAVTLGRHSASSFPTAPVAIGIVLAGVAAAGAILLLRRRPTIASSGSTGFSPPTTPPRPEPAPAPTEAAERVSVAEPVTVEPEESVRPADQGGESAPGPPAVRPKTVLASIPDGSRDLLAGTMATLLLGTPAVAGWPEDVALPAPTALEILVFLALHPGRRYSAEQIRDALCQRRKRVLEPGTIRRYINDMRQVLGARLPQARGTGGYELLDVTTDADLFESLNKRAAAADDPATKAALLADALSLVRGAPFADVPADAYGWVDLDDYIRGDLASPILTTSEALADLALAHDDTDLAIWAVRQGLRAWSAADSLFERFLLAAAADSPAHVARAWTEISDRLGAMQETPSAELYELYRRCRGSQ